MAIISTSFFEKMDGMKNHIFSVTWQREEKYQRYGNKYLYSCKLCGDHKNKQTKKLRNFSLEVGLSNPALYKLINSLTTHLNETNLSLNKHFYLFHIPGQNQHSGVKILYLTIR